MSRTPSPEELQKCIEILESFVDDRSRLAEVPLEVRVALLQAAGRLSRPERHEKVRASKAFRRFERTEKKSSDRAARDATEIRSARRAAVFTAPPQLVGGDAAPFEEARVLRTPKNCYVCKEAFTRLHFFYDQMCPECAAL